jgi:hypothetical protein
LIEQKIPKKKGVWERIGLRWKRGKIGEWWWFDGRLWVVGVEKCQRWCLGGDVKDGWWWVLDSKEIWGREVRENGGGECTALGENGGKRKRK